MLVCAVNVSEGRRADRLDALRRAAGAALLDLHADADHHRAVLTLAGEDTPRAVAHAAVALVDLRRHTGAHPRLGAVDVVPFVPVGGAALDEARAARDAFARWIAATLAVPAYLYGPERSLPEVRRRARRGAMRPDHGPSRPHPTAGAVAVGARAPLVAYNLWLRHPDLVRARRIASTLRRPGVQALGLRLGRHVQVSTNLLDPLRFGPAEAHDLVAAGAEVARAELVGLLPAAVLERVPEHRWAALDLGPARTIEARLAAHRPQGGG